MVVFLDLDQEAVPDDPLANANCMFMEQLSARLPFTKSSINNGSASENDAERLDPNLNVTTRALGCYPIINQITHSIDLNTLHALSRTCRQIRSTLLQYRSSLIHSTLHCTNETIAPSQGSPPSTPQWHFLGAEAEVAPHLVSGKVSICARDLVSDCWRCHTIICRNCTTKPSQAPRLPSRHRRLCPTCLAAPLDSLMISMVQGDEEQHQNQQNQQNQQKKKKKKKKTNEKMTITPTTTSQDSYFCTCPQRSHLCAPCGTKLVNADTIYRRIWTWRTRYTTYLGGLGTGIGEGNEGVKCARGRECLGAKDVEVEFECPSSSGSDGSSESSNAAASSSTSGSSGGVGSVGNSTGPTEPTTKRINTPGTTPDLEDKAGYWRQEIEGLGGVVKKKFRKRERVGRTVREWEDEREGKGDILGREKSGECRSWCGWCERVIEEQGGARGAKN